MIASIGKRLNASEWDIVYRSRLGRSGSKAVLKFSGLNGSPTNDQGCVRELSESGFTVLHGTWSSTSHWGSDTAQARAVAGINYIQSAPWSAASGKVALMGGSMGGLISLLLALNHPELVAAVAIGIPAVSPIHIHDTNLNGAFANSIEAAYSGLAGWNSAKATHDPLTRAAEFQSLGVPIKIWYSNNDPITPKADSEAFMQTSGVQGVNMGDIATGPVGYTGHDTYATFNQEAADFIKSYL